MIGGRNENAYSCQFLYLWWSGLDFLGTPYPRTFLLAARFNTAPATSIGQRQMVDHSHGSNSRPACFRLFKLGHHLLGSTPAQGLPQKFPQMSPSSSFIGGKLLQPRGEAWRLSQRSVVDESSR
jgi:hypothetical protein